MELNLDPVDGLSVHHVEAAMVFIGERELRRSFLLTPTQIVENWSCDDVSRLGVDAIEPILALQPELVILGSGEHQQFAPGEIQGILLGRGIGLECMDNAAAARTFNLLASESRHVVAAFILATGRSD